MNMKQPTILKSPITYILVGSTTILLSLCVRLYRDPTNVQVPMIFLLFGLLTFCFVLLFLYIINWFETHQQPKQKSPLQQAKDTIRTQLDDPVLGEMFKTSLNQTKQIETLLNSKQTKQCLQDSQRYEIMTTLIKRTKTISTVSQQPEEIYNTITTLEDCISENDKTITTLKKQLYLTQSHI